MDFYVEDRVLDIGVKIVFVAINDIDNHTVNEEWREYREKRIEIENNKKTLAKY